MPTYEYVCSSCGNQWEEIQKISEPALELCPKCQQATARRQISGGRFILKGGGWYADLYSSVKPGKKDETKAAPAAGESKPSGEGGGSSGTGTSGTASKETAAAPAPAPAAAPTTPR